MAPKSDNLAEEREEERKDQDGPSDEESEGSDPGSDESSEPEPKKKKRKKKKRKTDDRGEDGGEEDGKLFWTPHPILSRYKAWGLAAVSAVLCPISFAGFDIWPLAFVAWVPLILALRGQSPRRAAYLGWFAGFGMTMIGFYWLVAMLETFSGFPTYVCALFAAILCLEKGGRVALMAWMYARATHRRWHHALAFLSAFAVSELVWPVLFPWYFGAAMHETPIMMQTADIGGPILVSVVILAVNVAIAELLSKAVFERKADRRTLIAGGATIAFALAYGAFRLSSVQSSIDEAEVVKVGMVQGNSELRNARDPRRRQKHPLARHIQRTREMKKEGADLVVWSEAASQTRYELANYEQGAKEKIGRHLKVPTIIGAVLYERLETKGPKGRKARFYNTAMMVDEKGNITSRYDKQYLLMFGEYLPFAETFPVLYEWSPNSGAFSKGTSFEPLKWGEHRISTMICYEDIVPSFVNKLVDAGDPDLFVNMTNDAWFGATAEPWQHLALAKFRSVEHRKYMVRVTNTGMTAMIDPLGRVTATGSWYEKDKKNVDGEAILAEARWMKGSTIFAAIGEKPWWVLTVLLAGACFIRRDKLFGSA